MLNHASDPERRCTSLLKFDLPMDVEVEGVGQVKFRGFFSMKAGGWSWRERWLGWLLCGGWGGWDVVAASAGAASTGAGSADAGLLTSAPPRTMLTSRTSARRTCAPARLSPRPSAERDIEGGEQVLHTYGDLSDAQLLQT